MHACFAALLLAAVLMLVGVRSDEAALAGNMASAPAQSADRLEAAGLDTSGRAVRDVNFQLLTERVSDRRSMSDRDVDASATRLTVARPSAQFVSDPEAAGDSAPPRPLFYLHGALLI